MAQAEFTFELFVITFDAPAQIWHNRRVRRGACPRARSKASILWEPPLPSAIRRAAIRPDAVSFACSPARRGARERRRSGKQAALDPFRQVTLRHAFFSKPRAKSSTSGSVRRRAPRCKGAGRGHSTAWEAKALDLAATRWASIGCRRHRAALSADTGTEITASPSPTSAKTIPGVLPSAWAARTRSSAIYSLVLNLISLGTCVFFRRAASVARVSSR